ncbi:hypothetical protein LEP1GSC132_2017 [Leptospira kirschneri str. 200803703]|nr:hypothetical protein LEP1GSC082_4321 [Leptospira kirschneri str. H2]EKQ85092.1 hypothetical protein LEP1GSC064_1622 [Leptospira kirschneri serovar Grippotyphosa str. Moskva]EKR06886.1 hypothetical protein LEP1GSC122_0958 [Leptospira kirschneri serovar Valbuzzi str. 200702274]EMJ87290.1 hypothetical protein LEP1GSC198_3744 [Leptospira kirschneri str. JB]EMK02411.1 hypothetical protein LEP1GSC176_3186 [Leptospira kirschneri str. MMD1493]EMK17472.1 hypothetical protein LEP1GSC042_1216 [Leptosp
MNDQNIKYYVLHLTQSITLFGSFFGEILVYSGKTFYIGRSTEEGLH